MSEARAPHWQPDPLLARAPARSPSFVRMPWDEHNAQAFGPWRMQDKADPTGPQSEPAKNFAPAKAPGETQPDQPSAPMGQAADTAPGDAAETATAADAWPGQEGMGQETRGPAPAGQAAGAATVVVGGASEQELQVARQQGYVLGIKDGLSKALHDLEAERQKEREAIRSLMIELRALEQNPQRFFEPLRRLALHLAEQLVRGELTVSGQAIDRLVKSCLDDLGSHDKAVVAMLNPEDLQRLQALQIDAQSELRLEPDPALLPGSVRVRAHDAEIQDFIDHRLQALARRLLKDPEAWLQKSTLLHPHEVEPLPEDTPKRAWFSRPMDVQDAASKPAEPAAPEASSEIASTATDTTATDTTATDTTATDTTFTDTPAADATPTGDSNASPSPVPTATASGAEHDDLATAGTASANSPVPETAAPAADTGATRKPDPEPAA